MNIFLIVVLFGAHHIFALKYPINKIYTAGSCQSSIKFPSASDWGSYDTCNLTAPECDPTYKYRSFDGTCNNLDHPTWGMARSAFIRIFEPNYSDGVQLPPLSADGSELPDARKIVTTAFNSQNNPDNISLVVSQWAQLVSHDIAAPIAKTGISDCCTSDDPLLCLSIQVPEDDPFYSQYNVTCLSMIRSETALIGDCSNSSGARSQVNGVTHALDGSQIYGSSSEVAGSLREYEGGRLLVRTLADGRCFLLSEGTNCFNSDICYRAGEGRVNQNPQLTILQTLWVREHNRIADALAAIQPNWDDETLFQETRRIIIAMYTHITYNGFLPFILSQDYLNNHHLLSQNTGYCNYKEDVPNIVFVSFVNPVYRIFHSAVQGQLDFYNYNLNPTRYILLSDYLNSPAILEDDDNWDLLTLGLITQPMQTIDESYTTELTEKLFHFGKPYGTDLAALDIQRSRDFGVPGYPSILYACTGIEVNCFDDLIDLWPDEAVEIIRERYVSVDDIDLFVAINFENKKEGHRLGPVAECIIAEQFYRWKNGDRFWYENGNQPSSFTPEQLSEIRKSTLSRLICDTSDNIVNITLNSWLPPSETNPIISCDNIPCLDLSKWA